MAEIKIEKKNPIWPWILGLIVIAVAVYFLFLKDGSIFSTETTTTNDTIVDQTETQNATQTDENLSDVAIYVAFVNDDDGTMTLDHEYSHMALTKLIDATEEISAKVNFDSTMDLDGARKYADEITKNSESTTHADNIKKSSEMITSVLQNLQEVKFPNLKSKADKVSESSAAINVEQLTLNQKKDIKTFFDDAADLLEKMNN